ncbi:MAG: ABC-type dipeptide/oligopeptide/nickel transport system, permease component [Firmicutes bacterium]|nr:ABC-type dipeptide/oligopeptide/nickel transport system, permease component [Bacillota bacterium]
MLKYALKRIALMLPVLLGITLVAFLLLHAAPGQPIDLLAGDRTPPETRALLVKKWGLDRPLPVQYLQFLTNLVHGDLGRSILQNRPVTLLLKTALPITLEVGLFGIALSAVAGIAIGVVSAVRRDTLVDQAALVGALLGISMPNFWLALILMYLFSVRWQLLPSSGYGGIRHVILPGLALAAGGVALIARLTRSSVLEVLSQDYIRTARAKGLPERLVIYRHALKNALMPVVTVLGLRLGYMIAGAVVLEVVFSRPGMGRLMVNAILSRDYPVVQGTLVVLALSVMLANLVADLLYTAIDPRIHYQ